MGDRDYYSKDFMKRKNVFQPGADNAIVSVIILNLVIFTIIFSLWLIYLVTYDTQSAATQPFEDEILGNLNIPADNFLYKPWTVLSYMFTHYGFWRLFSNMLWLWAFGQIFQLIAGSDKIFPVYIYSGLVGGLCFVGASIAFPSNIAPEMMGAGASIMGLAIAATAMSPDYRLFPMLGNGIPLWILTALFVIIDIMSVSMSANLLIAHLSAGIMGFIYVSFLKQGKDIGSWMNNFGNWFMELFSPEKKYKKEKETLFYKAERQPYIKKPNLTQRKLDEILDKINQKGYESLTEEEKEFLKKASEHL